MKQFFLVNPQRWATIPVNQDEWIGKQNIEPFKKVPRAPPSAIDSRDWGDTGHVARLEGGLGDGRSASARG